MASRKYGIASPGLYATGAIASDYHPPGFNYDKAFYVPNSFLADSIFDLSDRVDDSGAVGEYENPILSFQEGKEKYLVVYRLFAGSIYDGVAAVVFQIILNVDHQGVNPSKSMIREFGQSGMPPTWSIDHVKLDSGALDIKATEFFSKKKSNFNLRLSIDHAYGIDDFKQDHSRFKRIIN